MHYGADNGGIVGKIDKEHTKGTWTDTARCEGVTRGMKPQLDSIEVTKNILLSQTF